MLLLQLLLLRLLLLQLAVAENVSRHLFRGASLTKLALIVSTALLQLRLLLLEATVHSSSPALHAVYLACSVLVSRLVRTVWRSWCRALLGRSTV
jgi:hypothetical protein